ncbi:MAG: hypothetical protein ACYSWR_06680, partial [Planctomycetota bacterium]
ETLSTVFEFCRDKCNLDVDSGCPVADCPIWQGLEDAGDLRADILRIINDWEPRESGHVGGVFHLCQELRNLINEPGCSCDNPDHSPADDSTAAEVGMVKTCPHVWQETKHYTLACTKCGKEISGSTTLDEMSDRFDQRKYSELMDRIRVDKETEEIQTPDEPDVYKEEE